MEKEAKTEKLINPKRLYPLLIKTERLLAAIELKDLDNDAPILLGWLERTLNGCLDECARIREDYDNFIATKY